MEADEGQLSPIDRALETAEECHLIEADGGRWEVVDLQLDGERVWITARMEGEEDSPRTFDTVLSGGTALEWSFSDGERLRVEQAGPEGGLRWERRAGGAFFDDPFLSW